MQYIERSPPTRRSEMTVVHCPCGVDVSGESDDELVTNVEQHIESDHPNMVGSYSREQILSMAHDH
jgi:predicted small metal-binding protein